MKIGILTFHCVHNSGAVLQAYALQEYLRRQKHLVGVIDYRPEYLVDTIRPAPKLLHSRPVRLVKHVAKFLSNYGGYLKYKDFICHQLSLCPYSFESLCNDFDAIIWGSDQIWNIKLTRGVDNVFWGLFPARRGVRFITYAASAGSDEGSIANIPNIENVLRRFDAISVRELSLKKVIQPLTLKNVAFVLDPTLLVPSQVLMRLTGTHSLCRFPYVFVYEVFPLQESTAIARNIAKQIDDNVVVVKLSAIKRRRGNVLFVNNAGPKDLLTYIRFAECVVTTSYHGTALSISFSKNFYTLKVNDGIDTRALSLLESLGLRDRQIGKADIPVYTAIDYEKVNILLNARRTESEAFLSSSLADSE